MYLKQDHPDAIRRYCSALPSLSISDGDARDEPGGGPDNEPRREGLAHGAQPIRINAQTEVPLRT